MISDLIEYIRRNSTPLEPIETGVSPILPELGGIKAVVFDIYGTLLISAAGDISLAGGESAPEAGMAKALPGADPEEVLRAYRQLIDEHQATRQAEGVEFPEVEIREVWAELLEKSGRDKAAASEACVVYECAVNPVWAMPGLQNCIAKIRGSGLHLGIVSNAQFYTPLIFPALLGQTLEDLGFDPELSVFSYQLREGKPSVRLYEQLANGLAKKQIEPRDVLYVGNDRLKDIWPAQKVGFRTALFAGDQRSYRLRSEDERLSGVEADAVITHLNQIESILQ